MRMNFVLVDFENVQPKNMDALRGGAFRVKVFVGANQSRFPREMVLALQALGTAAEYIEIAGSGVNALDFHIAFYIGRLAATHPDAEFTLISRDRGFDPLIRHLATLGITCHRLATISDVPGAGTPAPSAPGKRLPPTPVPLPTRLALSAAASTGKAKPKMPAAVRPPLVGATVPAKPARAKALPGARAVPLLDGMTERVALIETHLARARAARPATLKRLQSAIRNWLDRDMEQDEVDRIVSRLAVRGRVKIVDSKVVYPGST